MKSLKQFIAENLEASPLYKTPPRRHGYTISVGFSMLPVKKFINSRLSTKGVYNIDPDDGWFRKTENPAKGYGLMLRDVKLSSKKMPTVENGISVYPVNITFLPADVDEDDPSEYKKVQASMFINDNIDSSVTADDVIRYVNKNKDNWIP